jgi:hypothetical protein
MAFLQIAAPLIERGFSVIPIEKGGKRPVPGLGALSRTRDLPVLSAWAEQWPDANVGICADEDTVILETDDWEQFKTLVENGAGRHLSQGLTLMSCGSSENRPHLFFRRTEKATHVGNLVVPGLFEARFNNQYVVGPGSVHPGGDTYRFLNDLSVLPIPDWLVSELARLALSQKTGASPRSIEVLGGRVTEGSRHYFLMRELGRLWDGRISEEELTERALELNQQCDPPKDTAHVLQCVRDIMRREPYNPGPEVVIGKNGKTDKVENSPFKYPAVPGKTRDYILSPLHSPFDGWFPRGRVSIIGGSSGVGKTTLVVDILRKQRDRQSFLGHEGTGHSFLVLFSDRTNLSNRETLERMGLASYDMPIAYMPICWDGVAVGEIKDRIEQYGCPAVVFIEGADALVSDANKAQVVAPFMSGIQDVAQHYHTAVVLSCGAPKQKPKEQYSQSRDRVFGSQMWARMAEDILILSYGDGDERHLIVEHRNAKKETFDLVFDGGLLVPKPACAPLAGVEETAKAVTDSQAEMIEVIGEMEAGTRIAYRMFPWLSANTISRNLKNLSRPEAGFVGRDADGEWVVLKSNKGE